MFREKIGVLKDEQMQKKFDDKVIELVDCVVHSLCLYALRKHQ